MQTNDSLSIDGPVTITRDTWGIGHASAPSALAAFAAQGWLAASDRLWQMDWDRRRAFGRWAEVAGPPAVAEDKLFRRLDLAKRAQHNWSNLSAETKAMTEAYANGVNAWVDANTDDLPAEFDAHGTGFETWEPWHCVAVYQIRHFFMGTFHRKLWRGALALRADPALVHAMAGGLETDTVIVETDGPSADLLAEAQTILAAASEDLDGLPDTDGASNSWAIHGSRTASGSPLLAGDPHRGIEFPNVYYQCHIACDQFDAIGLSFPGVPGFPHFGHNADVAWCITHGMADDTDLFIEHGPLPVERVETIHVLDADPIDVTCASTSRGSIVLGDPTADDPSLGLQWTAWHGADTTFESLWPMLAAPNVDGFEASLHPWVIPVNSVLSADTSGNISFQVRGRLVERPVPNRWTPVAGDDASSWAGLEPVRFDQLPHERNPDRGFLVTANNRISDGGPYVSLDFANSARHDRIVQLLARLEQADVDAMTAIHRDVRSLVAKRLRPLLLLATPSTDLGRSALSLLAEWDEELRADSSAALVYSGLRIAWANEVARRLQLDGAHLIEPGFPSALFASRALFNCAHRLLEDGWQLIPGLETADLGLVLGAIVDDVASDLADRYGPDLDDWRWEQAHTMVSPHPLASARHQFAELHPPVVGVPGDNDTVRCASVIPVFGDRAAAGSVARYVFDLADWDRSGWIVPHGVSGVRGSGHDLDQRSAWLSGELVPMVYSSDAVAEVRELTFQL